MNTISKIIAQRSTIINKNKLTVWFWRRERVIRTELNKNSVTTFSLDTFYSTDWELELIQLVLIHLIDTLQSASQLITTHMRQSFRRLINTRPTHNYSHTTGNRRQSLYMRSICDSCFYCDFPTPLATDNSINSDKH